MKSEQLTEDHPGTLLKSKNTFPVVGLGASAGGLEAFKKLLKAIPEDSGMAFVLVQHLDPNHESLLIDILQKVTKIPILEITDKIKVAPNHIYVIPTNKILIANNGALELTPRSSKGKNKKNTTIDLFFSSLAAVHQSHSIGVVLSGTASDGVLGLKAIKDCGGITFAQDEFSATYADMPKNAVSAGVVDFVMAPDKIPQKLLEVTQMTKDINDQDTELKDETVFKQILTLLCSFKGTDFTYYKQTTTHRRIRRRMGINKIEAPILYLKYISESKTERNLLYLDLLIPGTSFFRDPKVFDSLQNTIFPDIIKSKGAGEHIRIWIAGCSTGEEVYSMASIFYDLLGGKQTMDTFTKIQIFGTDINEPAIAKARAGIYSENDVKELAPKQLKRYFTKGKNGYTVIKAIRDICVFAIHDFLNDPPFGRMDFLSCRNVLIYMEPYLQKKALVAFHYALNPVGHLLLGKSETISLPSLFTSYKKNEKIFMRKEGTSRFVPGRAHAPEKTGSLINEWANRHSMGSDFLKIANDIMLNRFTPASVVIDEAMDIIHFRGNTGKYLAPAPGKASLNVLKMVNQGLASELRGMVHKVKKEKRAIVRQNIPLYGNASEGTHNSFEGVDIEVVPLPNILEPHYLIVFQEKSTSIEKPSLALIENGQPQAAGVKKIKKDRKDLQIELLNQELMRLREDMRTITEDQDDVNQELKSSNEEMQSLYEEIETSKEELLSTNEELMVVNQETICLNEQLQKATDYAEAIVATIHEPLLVLDKKFRVRSVNNAFLEFFKVADKQEVEGMPFFGLENKQWNMPALRELLEDVLPNKSKFENFEVDQDFTRIGKRTLLLNAREIIGNKTEDKLLLLVMVDVTEKLKLQQKEKELLESFKNLLLQAPVAIMVLKVGNYRVEVANTAYLNIMGKERDFIGKPLFESLPELKTQGFQELLDAVVETGLPMNGSEMEVHIIKDMKGVQGFYNFVFHPLFNDSGEIIEIIVVANEVTEQVLSRKKAEETELRYHNMIYSSPSLIAIFKGKNMVIEIANDAIMDSWGKGKDIIGKYFFDVAPEAVAQGFDKILMNVFTTGETFYAHEMPVTLVRHGKPEQMFYTFVYHAQRDKNGEIDGVAIIANEVSAQVLLHKKLRESESHFRTMADLMPAKISNADEDGNALYFNKEWLEFTGMDFDAIKDLGYYKIIHPEDLAEFQERFQKASNDGADMKMEIRFINKDGDPVWHLNRATPIKDEAGNIKMWIGVTSDISDQIATRNSNLFKYKMRSKNLEELVALRTGELQDANEELLGSNAELIRTNLELEAFAYVSSHDLQEPLRKIHIFTGRILEKEGQNLTDKSKIYFKHIRDSVANMQILIKDLFAFSRLTKSERKFETVDINTIIKEIRQTLLGEEILQKQAKIEVQASCKLNVVVFQFHQLMYNLIVNSLKFSKRDVPPHIRIKAVEFESDGSKIGGLLPNTKYCHISFSDNGIGFEQEYSERIFEVFQKLHGKEEYSGTGIGLAIVKKIVNNHNGIITAKSEISKGATFDIYIPTN